MKKNNSILYIHGMGGGGDSRIPSILNESFVSLGEDVNIITRTYDFDPEIAAEEISEWVKEIEPSIIIGESLGSIHAIRISGKPHILVSPSINAPLFFYRLSWLTFIPGVTRLMDRIYKPKEGDRQKIHFTYSILKKYKHHYSEAMKNTPLSGSQDYFYAFFGSKDHYRRSGIVSISRWRKIFGDNIFIYPGTHFMEDEYIKSLLLPKILNILYSNK